MSFQDELNSLVEDVHASLGDMKSITLRSNTPGAFTVATMTRAQATAVSGAIGAIYRTRPMGMAGGAQEVEHLYQVEAADFSGVPVPGWEVVDSGVTRRVSSVESLCGGAAYLLACVTLKKN
jgi:hypothetical protein